MKVIIGLGNPGSQYQNTRHNLGFIVLDEYARKHLSYDITWSLENKLKAEIIKLSNDLWLIKPQTFMNNSGQAVSKIASYFKVKPEDIIIIHDDLDLPLGKIKIRQGGSGGGHHGVESIIQALDSDQFIRVRLGIGTIHSLRSEHDRQHMDIEHFVLEEFLPQEKSKVKRMVKEAVSAIDLLLDKGLPSAQNQYN